MNNIAKKIGEKINNADDINSHLNKIVESLKDKEPNKRKTLYAALLVLSEKNKKLSEKLRTLMMSDIEKFKEIENNQIKSEKQKDNWMEWSDILLLYDEYEKKYAMLLNKDVLNKKEFYQLQLYVILSLYILIPPLRSLNYTEFKIRNINKDIDNYRDKSTFVFNIYKNANKKGKDIIDIPPNLRDIIIKWENLNDNDYLLVDTKKNKLTQTKLNNILNNFFGKSIGPSMLRHIYLSHKFGNVNLKEIEDTANNMQHSILQNMKYIKR